MFRDCDKRKLSDYKMVKEGNKLVRPGNYERTEEIMDNGRRRYYVHPPETSKEHPMRFESKTCNIVPEEFECTRCGVTLGYCLTHKTIHCGCGVEVRNGHRLSPPLRYSWYHSSYCKKLPMTSTECSKCHRSGPDLLYCYYHNRIHCGCDETRLEDWE